MSFQAHLDNVEKNAGTIPIRFQEMVRARGCEDPKTKAGVILAGLANDYGLGRGHGSGPVIKNGATIKASAGQLYGVMFCQVAG